MTEEVEFTFEDVTFGGEVDKEDVEDLDLESKPDDKNALFVFTTYGGKLNVPALVKLAEQSGPLKQHNFREKQCFGFLQYNTPEAMEKALTALNNLDVDGFKIGVERCAKITPGRDPRTHESTSEFKNSTLVLKNLPFQLKQEKLEEMLAVYDWKPLSVSYLYDGTGMFRGMAFVKYKDIEEAKKIFEAINNMDIAGRKLRVEYKRKVAEAETDENNSGKLVDQLNTFKSNSAISELAFPCASSFQRKQIHQLAEKLGLVHFSTGETDQTRYVLVKKKDPEAMMITPNPMIGVTPPSSSPIGTPGKAQPIKVHSNSNNNSAGRRNSHTEYRQRNSFDARSSSPDDKGIPFGSLEKGNNGNPRSFGGVVGSGGSGFGSLRSPPSSLTASLNSGSPHLPTASPKYGNSALVFNRILQEGPAVSPVRQPKGPDGSTGFGEVYRKARKRE